MEILMALVVMGIALVCVYHALQTGFMRFNTQQNRNVDQMELNTAFAILSQDLRCAFFESDRPETGFVGQKDALHFVRMSRNEEETLVDVTYGLETDAENGARMLCRYARPVEFLDSPPKKTLLCDNVKKFSFRYFDGAMWNDTWGWDNSQNKPFQGIQGLPLFVSVHLNPSDEEAGAPDDDWVFPVMTTLLNKSLHG